MAARRNHAAQGRLAQGEDQQVEHADDQDRKPMAVAARRSEVARSREEEAGHRSQDESAVPTAQGLADGDCMQGAARRVNQAGERLPEDEDRNSWREFVARCPDPPSEGSAC